MPTRQYMYSCLRSELVEFVVGKDNDIETYQVHKAFVVKESPTLAALVSNGMQETIEKKVVLSEVTPDTFVYFVEFAMAGKYTLPGSTIDVELKSHDGNAANGAASEQQPSKGSTSSLKPLSEAAGSSAPLSSIKIAKRGKDESFEEDLLDHCKVYIFADTYNAQDLSKYVLEEIDHLLIGLKFILDGEADVDPRKWVNEIAGSIRYIYSHTPENDKIRNRIATYCAKNIEKLMSHQEFKDLQAEGGKFILDLMNAVVNVRKEPAPTTIVQPAIMHRKRHRLG